MRMIGILAALVACGLASSSVADQKSTPDDKLMENVIVTAQAQRKGLHLVLMRDGRRGQDRDQRVAVVAQDWLYCSPVDKSLYVVPTGYVTDFASVPWYGRMFFPQFGQWAEASVIHDWLYDIGETGRRAYADQVFKVAIEEQTHGKVASTLMYWAVRVGGGGPYKDAGRRDPETWRRHFADLQGEEVEEPPFPQPTKAAWRLNFDCSKLEDQEAVDELLAEYHDEMAEQEEARDNAAAHPGRPSRP